MYKAGHAAKDATVAMRCDEEQCIHPWLQWPSRLKGKFPNNQTACVCSFDIVMSSDVLEHIHEDEADKVISELVRVSRRHLFLSISLKPHTKVRSGDFDGCHAHVFCRCTGAGLHASSLWQCCAAGRCQRTTRRRRTGTRCCGRANGGRQSLRRTGQR